MKKNNREVIGIIPVRMGSSRFPGKPLAKISGLPMIGHIYFRSLMVKKIDRLYVATCDEEIREYCESIGAEVLMTSDKHTRALDRVAEATCQIVDRKSNPIVLNIQGDEPLIQPQVIEELLAEFQDDNVCSALLAIPIKTKELFENPDTVKVIVSKSGYMAYSSRGLIPYQKNANNIEHAHRIAGLFAFKLQELLKFTLLSESPLEILESCDVNRMIDNNMPVKVSIVDIENYYSVDRLSDIGLVESVMVNDELHKIYKTN
ncbi:3-deoxy-manno-octulosonate cytidylyltransferase [Candidatus Thioglobus autotrophicus]|uniref:3-deoxy-manno-octulosonate cytidylyltransferase n=1 Tax=Candidatus Thioglobus autotrophicus TaxID=1705394 RepID=UPI00299D9FE3|nr:3-deoxy-manno-octulosonate cytidylyltransferase [Candidatus Thioglobus autotrophicus]WPE17754.1 3-deoxy-manno-octulosonate cytidylyltransferase [Candidatus Thioglobus autotrophicus]